MSDQHRQADVTDAFEAYYRQEARKAARFQNSRRQAQQMALSRSAHPLEYDDSGFPIHQDNPSLTDRIRFLLQT